VNVIGVYCGGMDDEQVFPVIRQTTLDTTDPRRLAEFYRQLFGLRYVPGDEPPGPGQPDPKGQDWLILTSPAGGAALPRTNRVTWPGPARRAASAQSAADDSSATAPNGEIPGRYLTAFPYRTPNSACSPVSAAKTGLSRGCVSATRQRYPR